ncbi:MAG: methyltransferase [Beijerinckiaceae bacterium]|nr:methyltransferase [Beijerinckiaceae bacterium]
MGEALEDAGPLTRDAFFGGRLVLLQPAKGHRAGTDAVLLAASVPAGFSGLVYDAGAGVGTAGLGVAGACPAARVGLVENDLLSAEIAAQNIVLNRLSERVVLHACDLLDGASRQAAGILGRADLVMTNPPFHEPGTVRESPDPRRRAAHVGGEGGLAAWISACVSLLGPKGALIVIHTVEALPLLLRSLERGLGAVTILPIHTKAGAPARRILVRAVRGSRAPLAIMPGLVLQEGEKRTDLAERINRGEAGVGW